MAHSRDFSESNVHHIFNRGVDRQDIFTLDGDQRLLEALLAEACERFGITLHAYAFMSNHIHLLVEIPDGASMSAAMQFVESQYARVYNVRCEREGPLFTGRFKNVAVLDDDQFLTAARYIDRNPLEFTSAETLASYRYSSLAVHAGRRTCPMWLCEKRVADHFADGDAYLSFVLQDLPSDRLRSGALPPLRATDIDDLDGAASLVFELETTAFLSPNPGQANHPRDIVTALAVETRAADLPTVSSRYGFSSLSAARRACARGKALFVRDPSAARQRDRILNTLNTFC